MNFIKPHFFLVQILIFASLNMLIAQSNIIEQKFNPHPSIQIDDWYFHDGDLSLEEVVEVNQSIWTLENLNKPASERHGAKWYKKDVQIPDYLVGLDLILHVKVESSAIVYLNGKELFSTSENFSKGFLSLSVKKNERHSLQIRIEEGSHGNRFYNAKIVGMPKGYGHFLSAFSLAPLKGGITISDWKFKKGANDAASQKDFIDSHWGNRTSGKAWRGEMQHGWYRKKIILPKEINGFQVEGKAVRLLVNTNDKGEIWIDGSFYQKFRDGNGDVIISNLASIESSYQIAIKAINEWGTGDVRSASIITDEAYKIKNAYDDLKIGLNRLDDYCEKHPSPNMTVINKVTAVIEKNQYSDYATKILRTSEEIKNVENELANKPAFLILPYLQNLQSDGITIMWETIYPSHGKVLYGENEDLNMWALEDEIPSAMHEITLNGLKQNTTYTYRVECNNITSVERKFTTKKEKIAPFKFVVLGDTRSRHDVHKKIVNRIIDQDPLFVINTGDMVSDGKEKSDWEAFFSINRELMSSTPYYPVLGNHERNSSQYYDVFSLPNNERYYSFNVGDALFVILDSEGEDLLDLVYIPNENSEKYWQKNFGEYFVNQKKWLENVLEQNSDTEFIFVFQHKPLYSVMKRRVAEAERYRAIWGDIFDKYNVQVFMNGHDHHYHHALKNGTHYITTAGGGAGLYNMDGPITETVKLSKIEHFVLVNINKNEAILNVIDIDGNELDKITVSKRKTN